MLTIGQLADYAGVSVRAIRHYHQCGLLSEPPRDASGYRRYDARAVITLTRIKALASSGVPLREVPALLEAPQVELDEVVDRLDISLARRIEELQTARLRLQALRAGDRMCLPDSVRGHLERLEGLGLAGDQLMIERDMWILLFALYPDRIPRWLARLNTLLDDRDIARLYLDIHGARTWSPDDPRLADIADRALELSQRDRDQPSEAAGDMREDLRALRLVDTYGSDVSAAWRRISELADRRARAGAGAERAKVAPR